MSVTTLVIGDPHFKVSNVKDTDRMVEALITLAKEKNPDIIVVLGDVLDRHESIHVSPLVRATNFLAELMKIAPTYVLIGNHDLKNNRQFLSEEHPFTALKFWGNKMTIVDTTTVVTIKDKLFVFVPYVPPGRFEEALNECEGWQEATCIFAHQEFKGAQMGPIVSTEGDVWSLTSPYVVSGHIHDYQEPQANILYTGTPIQHTYGDHDNKTISYFTFYSPNQRDHLRIDLRLPRKRIVRLKCCEVSDYKPEVDSEIKIIITGTSGEIKAIMKHINIETWKKAGYKIVYKDVPNDNPHDSSVYQAGAPLKFSTVLYNKVSTDPKLHSLYKDIFGDVGKNNNNNKQNNEPVIKLSLCKINST